jgi:hypothetical protein
MIDSGPHLILPRHIGSTHDRISSWFQAILAVPVTLHPSSCFLSEALLQMPDPLTKLPYEIWARCIELAVRNQPTGPLAFIMVSQNWQRELLCSPDLWSYIWIQNDEDETARIWIFLHLSGHRPLHVLVKTVLPTTDSLQLIKPHLSRVKTILITPEMPHPLTSLHGEQWKQAASIVMTAFSDKLNPWNATDYVCSGWRIGTDPGVYHIAAMQFSLSHAEAMPAGTNAQIWDNSTSLPNEWERFCVWKNYIARCVCYPLLAEVW